MRKVIAAACKSDFVTVCGARHFDKVMQNQLQAIYGNDIPSVKWEQGFIDQGGIFMCRKEALKVAKKAGQMIARTNAKILISEDLY